MQPYTPDQLQLMEQNYQYEQQRRQQMAAMQAQQQQQQQQSGSNAPFWTNFISEGGGIGGAAAGAGIGTLLFPGVGTLAGGIIGGFLGGTGGRLLEDQVRTGKTDMGSALGEGGLDALFSGIGPAFQLGKAGVMAGRAAMAARGGATALDAVTGNTIRDLFTNPNAIRGGAGVIQTMGKNIEAGGLGLAQGAKASGMASGLGARQSDTLLNTLRTLKIPLGSPEATQRALEPTLSRLGDQIGSAYTKANVALSPAELNNLGSNILGRIGTMGGLDESASNYAIEQARRLVQAGDVKGLWQFTKDLEANTINFARGAQSAEPMKEAVAQIIKGDVRDFLNSKVPQLAELNNVYHNALTANNLLIAASRNSKAGLWGRLLSLSPVKAAETKLGSGIETLGKYTAGTGGPLTKLTQQAVRQFPAHAIELFSTPNGQQPNTMANSPAQFGSYDQLAASMGGMPGAMPNGALTGEVINPGGGAGGYPAQPASGLQYSSVDLANAALRALQNNDLNAYKTLADASTMAQQIEQQQAAGGGAGGMNVTKVTSQQYGLAASAMQSLGQLGQMIQSNPNVLRSLAIPGQGLGGGIGNLISNNAGTAQYNAVGYTIADNLLRLKTGAQANESEIRQVQSQIMPGPFDSPEVVQTKLNQLQQYFGTVLQLAQSGGVSAGGSDFASQLEQSMGMSPGSLASQGAGAYGY